MSTIEEPENMVNGRVSLSSEGEKTYLDTIRTSEEAYRRTIMFNSERYIERLEKTSYEYVQHIAKVNRTNTISTICSIASTLGLLVVVFKLLGV